ncbi:putative mannan endo-1,4-beta-mannosidase A [Leucoagaricus sp. SymC.cos]|nr:putative mannan endo-1,4-beta-mannosidase A [Leucoagaricus sp. SymC.cos]
MGTQWLPLLTSQHDVEATFKEMQAGGVKVVRTWGFNAINGSELAGALESGLTYYQVWNSSDWVLNDGPQGLHRLDNVVETAGKYGIKLILTFTNNWVGYGGMELYINWIAGAGNTHDVFYTDKRIIASYQRYVQTIVNRYKDSPSIFAWELMNEARCLGDLPGGPNCVPGSNTLHMWYKQQADFVRSLDPRHMITTGGEGHFYWKKPVCYWLNHTCVSDYNYNGQAGEDFDLDLQLENIDFGTYVRPFFSVWSALIYLHIYPQSWYAPLDFPGSNWTTKSWGLEWIQQHANAAKKANKPLVLEEFGLAGFENKTDTYPTWVDLALKTEHGIIPWQFGVNGLTESGGNRVIKYADALIDGVSSCLLNPAL